VTDSGGLLGSASITVIVMSGGEGEISLTVVGRKKAVKYADLTWSGATSTNVDVYRDDSLIITTANDGAHTDGPFKGGGSHTYKVCEDRNINLL
jgi:hypothetical protein